MELMKLDEAKEIIRKELQKDIVWLRNNEKNNYYFADKYRKEANAYHTVLQELDHLKKENEDKKTYEYGVIVGTKREREHWENKIRERMEELDEKVFSKPYDIDTADGSHSQAMGMWLMCRELLKEE